MHGFSAFSLDFLFFTETASVLPDHAHFLPTQTSVLDRHAEERVFVLLVVGGKGVLVKQHEFRVIRAGFHEVGKILSNRSDQGGLSFHTLVIRHRVMRIADSDSQQVPQVANIPRRRSPRG